MDHESKPIRPAGGEAGVRRKHSPEVAAALDPRLLKQLTSPFPAEEFLERDLYSTLDRQMAIVELYLPPLAVRDRLEDILGLDAYVEEYELVQSDPPTVICRLSLLGVTKTGMANSEDVGVAQDEAFLKAALAFGIGREVYKLRSFWIKRRQGVEACDPRAGIIFDLSDQSGRARR